MKLIRKMKLGIYHAMQQNYWSSKVLDKLLSDEKSKIARKGVMNYRRMVCPLSKELYSEYDQYFCKDIIKLYDGEVFTDGGVYGYYSTISGYMQKEKILC